MTVKPVRKSVLTENLHQYQQKTRRNQQKQITFFKRGIEMYFNNDTYAV